jgi:phosphatidylglycerophosphatase A
MNNPVYKEDNKWYFWDETWAYRCGPFLTEQEAEWRLLLYCLFVLDDCKKIGEIELFGI